MILIDVMPNDNSELQLATFSNKLLIDYESKQGYKKIDRPHPAWKLLARKFCLLSLFSNLAISETITRSVLDLRTVTVAFDVLTVIISRPLKMYKIRYRFT